MARKTLPVAREEGTALPSVLASSRSSAVGGGTPSIGFALDLLDDRSVRLQDHRERKAQEDRAGVQELAKHVPVGVVEQLGAVEVRRHELRLAGERPALRLAVGAGDLRPCCVISSLMEPVNQGSRPRSSVTVATTATRIAGSTATRLNSPTMRTCSPAAAAPARRSRISRPGLPGHDADQQQDEDAVDDEHADDDVVGRAGSA